MVKKFCHCETILMHFTPLLWVLIDAIELAVTKNNPRAKPDICRVDGGARRSKTFVGGSILNDTDLYVLFPTYLDCVDLVENAR